MQDFLGNDESIPSFQVFSRFQYVIEISSLFRVAPMLVEINCPWWKILLASLTERAGDFEFGIGE